MFTGFSGCVATQRCACCSSRTSYVTWTWWWHGSVITCINLSAAVAAAAADSMLAVYSVRSLPVIDLEKRGELSPSFTSQPFDRVYHSLLLNT